jgi:hypothetical protein
MQERGSTIAVVQVASVDRGRGGSVLPHHSASYVPTRLRTWPVQQDCRHPSATTTHTAAGTAPTRRPLATTTRRATAHDGWWTAPALLLLGFKHCEHVIDREALGHAHLDEVVAGRRHSPVQPRRRPRRLAWGPTEATAHLLLYTTMGVFDDGGVWLTSEGGGAGDRIVATMELGYGEFVHDVAWLPDGSGFVFSGFLFPEDDPFDYDNAGNVYHYDFASSQRTQITSFADEYVGALTVAPDGVHLVFELGAELASEAPPELWIVRLDGTGLRRLADYGRAPAWSR